jgi:hypothetical protein
MRETLFILLVVFGLLAWTAFRYRKQIAGMIGFAKMLREAKDGLIQGSNQGGKQTEKAMPLVNCIKCGIWVPQTKARKVGDLFFCSDVCLSQKA